GLRAVDGRSSDEGVCDPRRRRGGPSRTRRRHDGGRRAPPPGRVARAGLVTVPAVGQPRSGEDFRFVMPTTLGPITAAHPTCRAGGRRVPADGNGGAPGGFTLGSTTHSHPIQEER